MKVFSALPEISPPKIKYTAKNFSLKRLEDAERKYITKLAKQVRSLGYTGPYTGELFYIPFADGHAKYMVIDAPRNFALMHLPLGDGYSAPAYMTRGVRKQDVIDFIKRGKRLVKQVKKSATKRTASRD